MGLEEETVKWNVENELVHMAELTLGGKLVHSCEGTCMLRLEFWAVRYTIKLLHRFLTLWFLICVNIGNCYVHISNTCPYHPMLNLREISLCFFIQDNGHENPQILTWAGMGKYLQVFSRPFSNFHIY